MNYMNNTFGWPAHHDYSDYLLLHGGNRNGNPRS